MPARKALPIELSFEHERELSALVRAHSTPQKLAERARIILLSARGLGVAETANELGIWRKTASTWRRRWRDADATAGVAVRLSDAPRSGAPASFTRSMSRSAIGARANSPARRSGVASLNVSRMAPSGAF
jgi:putative transposase